MKAILKFKLIFLTSLLLIVGCGSDDDSSARRSCDESSSDFQSLYQNMLITGHTDDYTMDLETHEYTFTLSANKEVCKIGYQSQPSMATEPYLIEIVNNDTSTTVYTNSHIFSSTATSYVVPTSTINLTAGVSYTVKRTQYAVTSIADVIGRGAGKSSMSFPYVNGVMTITGSNFYGAGGPVPDFRVPYIDLILR